MLRSLFAVACLIATPALAEAPRVATDIPAVHSLAARVMEGVGTPDLVMQPGASPHGYAMRPSEAATLDQAEVVFHVGDALTPWLDGALAELAGDAQVVELIGLPGAVRYGFREGVIFAELDDHAHEGGHDHHDEHEHSNEGLDPHAWLDPVNGKLWLESMANVLAGVDPKNGALYQANASAGQAELEVATSNIADLLAGKSDARFVVFHDAYQYFERRFDLSVLGAISVADAASPSPARLAALRDAIAEKDVTCVFSEPQFSPGLIKAITAGNTTRTAVLDPQGASIPTGPGLYVELLTSMAEAIADCL